MRGPPCPFPSLPRRQDLTRFSLYRLSSSYPSNNSFFLFHSIRKLAIFHPPIITARASQRYAWVGFLNELFPSPPGREFAYSPYVFPGNDYTLLGFRWSHIEFGMRSGVHLPAGSSFRSRTIGSFADTRVPPPLGSGRFVELFYEDRSIPAVNGTIVARG